MRIIRTDKLNNPYDKKPVKRVENKGSVHYGKDKVEFSSFAKEMQIASKSVKEATDVRMDKVNKLKAQIEAGKYNVSAADIADKILGF